MAHKKMGTPAGALALVLALVFALILGGCENPTDGDSGPVYTVDFSLPAAEKYTSIGDTWVSTGDEGDQFLNLEYHKVREAMVDAVWAYVNEGGRANTDTFPANQELDLSGNFSGKKIKVLSGSWSKTERETVNAGNPGTLTDFVTAKVEVVGDALTYGSGDRSFKVQAGSKCEIKETNTRTFAAQVGGASGRGEETSNIRSRERGYSFIVTDAQYNVNNQSVTKNGLMQRWEKYTETSGAKHRVEEQWASDKDRKVWSHKTNTNEDSRYLLGADW